MKNSFTESSPVSHDKFPTNTLSCGSPGEVANAPAQGHRLPMRALPEGEADLYDDLYEHRATRESPPCPCKTCIRPPGPARHSAASAGLSDAKQAVWVARALQARGQLRQRVAWVLAQGEDIVLSFENASAALAEAPDYSALENFIKPMKNPRFIHG